MMSPFGEYLYEAMSIRPRGGLPLLTRVMLLAALVMIAPAYSDEERRDYFGDYRLPSGFVYTEATITPEKARELAQQYRVLTLANVTEVSSAVAKALATPDEDTFLTLPALANLDEEAALMLAQRYGCLRLWGLKSVTPEVAAALVSHDGDRLELNGIKELSPAAARALAKGRRSWGISVGLIDLPPEIAAILAEFRYDLDFPYLETLSLESAKAIAEHGEVVQRGSETVGPTLDLGKARLTPAIAEALLTHDGPLSLNRLRKLEPGVGDILAKHRFEVLLMLEEIDSVALARKIFSQSHRSSSVARLRTMSPEIATEYARAVPGSIPGSLLALETLTPEAATVLATVSSWIRLHGLSQLTPELAKALTDRKPPVHFLGIKTLEGPDALAVAETLASTPAPVYLGNLERVSAPALAALRKKATITLPPNEELTIVP
jgi:hypothetical protein